MTRVSWGDDPNCENSGMFGLFKGKHCPLMVSLGTLSGHLFIGLSQSWTRRVAVSERRCVGLMNYDRPPPHLLGMGLTPSLSLFFFDTVS